VRDKTDPASPCSIAAVGLALASIPVIVERGVVIRKFAAKIARRRLRSLLELPQGPEADAAGNKGFFSHFLDIDTGRRVWDCELSTLDSAFLFAGVLTCATYFDADTADEAEVRRPADTLYRRADWEWARAFCTWRSKVLRTLRKSSRRASSFSASTGPTVFSTM
jgi:hypothetical protein